MRGTANIPWLCWVTWVKRAGGTHATTAHVLQPEMVSLLSRFDIAFDL